MLNSAAISYERTFDRLARMDAETIQRFGFPQTVPGRALVTKYAPDLAAIIAEARASRHGNNATEIWAAVSDRSDKNLAINILAIALQASAMRHDIFGEWASHIGTQLGFRGKLALKIGMWSADLLRKLPIFTGVLADGGLELNLNGTDDRALINGALDHARRARPLLLPLQEPPMWAPASECADAIDWPDPALVSHHPSVAKEFATAIDNGRAQPVIDAVNWLQGTPFTINEPILNLLLSEPGPPAPPPKPPFWQKDRYEEWVSAYSKSYSWNWMLQEARLVADWDRFFNPLTLDFRGRVNAIPQFAFQREDAVRALFLFENSAPIGKDGMSWLKAHVAARANGCPWSDIPKPDRLNFDGRNAWIDRHLKTVLLIGEAILEGRPLYSDDLPDSDERYQFASACAELAAAIDDPTFETRLPLVFDASCSGLQHIAMITRSEDGRYANLTPNEEPSDFYQIVADRVRDTTDVLSDIPNVHHRAIVKQPVMTFFYGVTDYGMSVQILEKLKDLRINEPNHNKSRKIAKAIIAAIEDIATSKKEVRDFLESVAAAYAASNQIMRWDTPLGLPILNPYYEMIIETVSYRVNGKRQRVNWCVGNTDNVLSRKATQSVTANFIHSCDAALLHSVALAAKAEGIELVTVHDCFGTIAPHARRLNEILREQLIKLHTEHDWLQEVYATTRKELPGANLRNLPVKGSLDSRLVKHSFFAFS
jgi:DNA-directed RNA polymerase